MSEMEHRYRLIQVKDSVIRVDCKTGHTWILGNKDLIWHKIEEEK